MQKIWTKNENIEGNGEDQNIESKGKEDDETIDELEQIELREEQYLKADAVAKQQFEYNRNVALANDFPELQVKINDPIEMAPGEGIHRFYLNGKKK